MSESFERGYDFFQKNAGNLFETFQSDTFGRDRVQYVADVEDAIESLDKDMNSFKGMHTDSKLLKGDIAEFWHGDTFNVDAAINRSSHKTFIDRSHNFASVDISSNYGENYGLKYYANGQFSAKAQATSVFERFKQYQADGGEDSLDKFLRDRNYDSTAVLNDPIYSGQIRVIPSDQMKEAVKWLEKKIAAEKMKRPDQVKRYQETLAMLKDRLADNEGNESIPLSRKNAERLATLAKEGKFKAEDFGISAPDALPVEMLVKNSLKSGMSAAVITLVLKVGPEIYKALDYLIQNGEVDEKQFRKIGTMALSGSAEGFLRGSIASAISLCCSTKTFGEQLYNINPTVIGAVTAIAMNTIENAFDVARGKKSRTELANSLVSDVIVSASSVAGGMLGQAVVPVPVLGYMLGSFIGSVVGGFASNTEQNLTLSFCAETGITMFGLVEQDYKLPDDVIKDIGVETFDYETFEPESFSPESFAFASFDPDTFNAESLGIKFLRRGVIGISKIGYIE